MKIKLNNYQSDLSDIIKTIVNNEKLSKKLFKYFKNATKNKLEIVFKDSNVYISLDKIKIINILEKIDDLDINKVMYLKELTSYKKLKENCEDKNFVYFFDKIPNKVLFEFLELKHDDFKVKFNKRIINGYVRNKFLENIYDFIDKYRFEINYDISDNIKENIRYLRNHHSELTLDNIYNNEPKYMKKIELNEKFKENILKSVPESFNDFEKAFYIYYKLCSILTYDEDIFGFDKKIDSKHIKHSSMDRVKEIDNINNKIVCFEFNVIFAKFLNELGIKYSFNGPLKYGKGHNSLIFVYKGVAIKVDSLEQSVIHSDLAHAKNNIKLSGFNIKSGNEEMQEQCEKSKNNVYEYIKQNENIDSRTYIEKIKEIKDEVGEELTVEEKIEIYFKKVLSVNIPITDKLEILILLKKSLFDQNKNLEIYFIKNNNNFSKINVIFVHTKEEGEKKYFILDDNQNIKTINIDEINANFASGKFTYCGKNYDNIPGVSLENNTNYKTI